jgi:hypothetical protein
LWAALIQFNFRSFPLSAELSEDFPEISEDFPEISEDFPEVLPVEIKREHAMSGDRSHYLWITDPTLYLSATAVTVKEV